MTYAVKKGKGDDGFIFSQNSSLFFCKPSNCIFTTSDGLILLFGLINSALETEIEIKKIVINFSNKNFFLNMIYNFN